MYRFLIMSLRHSPLPQLNIQNLFFSYDYTPVLINISCSLSAGRSLIIRGKNGSGKSTFLRLIAGLLIPTNGYIKLPPPP